MYYIIYCIILYNNTKNIIIIVICTFLIKYINLYIIINVYIYIYILYKSCYIKYKDILIYLYLNYNNIVLNSINIIRKIKFHKIFKKIIIIMYSIIIK